MQSVPINEFPVKNRGILRFSTGLLTATVPIEHPIVDRFVEMRRLNAGAAVEIGSRAGDPQNFVVAASDWPSSVIVERKSAAAASSSLRLTIVSGGRAGKSHIVIRHGSTPRQYA
jgi:hypothetical protein